MAAAAEAEAQRRGLGVVVAVMDISGDSPTVDEEIANTGAAALVAK